MVELGKQNCLSVIKRVDFGVYLDGEQLGEILLPNGQGGDDLTVDESIEVFLYLDSEDRPIATTQKPTLQLGQCGYLEVVDVNRVGAFLDWGLPKHLLVPFSEQQKPMQKGRSYMVYLYLDSASQRFVASAKLDKFFADSSSYYKAGQAVEFLICGRTELGYKAIIDQTVIGLLFESDAIVKPRYGQQYQGYIKRVRQDGKLDLCFQLTDREALDSLAEKILVFIKKQGGQIQLTDKSSPQAIASQFGVSKSSYKKALGKLYQKRLILIEKDHIRLSD